MSDHRKGALRRGNESPRALTEYPDVLLPREVADLLRVSTRTVYRAINEGALPAIRVGRRVVVPRRALERLLDRSR
jgi:excisionase family DNA binding protein